MHYNENNLQINKQNAKFIVKGKLKITLCGNYLKDDKKYFFYKKSSIVYN